MQFSACHQLSDFVSIVQESRISPFPLPKQLGLPFKVPQRGTEIQAYCAIIACLLISLWTGRKPTLRTYEMICFYFSGLASAEELLAHIAKLKARDEAAKKI